MFSLFYDKVLLEMRATHRKEYDISFMKRIFLLFMKVCAICKRQCMQGMKEAMYSLSEKVITVNEYHAFYLFRNMLFVWIA